MQKKITTFLTFEGRAEEAVAFHLDLRRLADPQHDARTRRNDDVAWFELAGQELLALNGGPTCNFSQGISLFVDCETQEEDRPAVEPGSRRRGARAVRVAGPTGSASRGRSFPGPSASCWGRGSREGGPGSCRRCCRWARSRIEGLQRAYDAA